MNLNMTAGQLACRLLRPCAQYGGGHGGRVPPLFQTGGHNTPRPPLFPLWVLYLRGFKNESVICHVLCEEVFMLAGRPHIAKFMLKQSLVWYH